MLCLSSLENWLWDAYIMYIAFQKGVNNFDMQHKHANFWLVVQYSP